MNTAEKPMFDQNRFEERVQTIINNLRNFANTKCTGPDALLKSSELLRQAVAGSLEAYDEELAALAADRDQWAKRATP